MLGQQRHVEGLLGVEVPVDDRLADARGRGDVVDPGGGVAVAGEEITRGARDRRPALIGRHPLRSRESRTAIIVTEE